MADYTLPISLAVPSDQATDGPHTTFPVGSTHPALVVALHDATGEPIDLTEAVSGTLRLYERDELVVEARMEFGDREAGRLRYRWADRDVDSPGVYRGRVTVRFRDGREMKAPTGDPLTVTTTDLP